LSDVDLKTAVGHGPVQQRLQGSELAVIDRLRRAAALHQGIFPRDDVRLRERGGAFHPGRFTEVPKVTAPLVDRGFLRTRLFGPGVDQIVPTLSLLIT
jgi:hypothetical protein